MHWWFCCFITLSAVTAHGTDVWFNDIEAKSPNGRYVATAKSPDNRRKEPKPFQSNFKYALYDKSTGEKLWEFSDPDEPAGDIWPQWQLLLVARRKWKRTATFVTRELA